jgi:CHAD domain-containing protein
MSEHADRDHALVKYADKLVEELRDNVQGALREFDEDAVHDARVATRRLSAALDLLHPVLSGGPRKKFERVLKKLRRRLGPMRDLDVMIEHLHELTPAAADKSAERSESTAAPAGPHRQAIAWMIDRLEEERADARKKVGQKKSIPRIMDSLSAWWNLHEELTEADEAAATLLADSIHLQLDAFSERAVRETKGEKGAKGANGMNGNGSHPAKNGKSAKPKESAQGGQGGRPDPHALRKAGKALRYTLELADHTGQPLPPGTIRAFKKMQDALGLWHDYAVLADSVMQASLDEMLAFHDPALQLKVLDLARFAVRRSSRALVRFDRLWQRRGTPLTTAIRDAFPLTKDPTAEPPAVDQSEAKVTPAAEPINSAAEPEAEPTAAPPTPEHSETQ